MPGVPQNAIDRAVAAGHDVPLAGKPVGTIGAPPGAIGGARAQQQLKLVLPPAGVVGRGAMEKFVASGVLARKPTCQFVAVYLKELEAWTQRVSP